MLKFSSKVRKAYSGSPQTLKDIEELHARARTYLRPTLQDTDTSVVAKIPHKAWTLLQIGLRRGLELTEATVREVNAHALVPAFVLVRSLFEVANLRFFTWEKIEAVLSSQSSSDLVALDNDLMALALGT